MVGRGEDHEALALGVEGKGVQRPHRRLHVALVEQPYAKDDKLSVKQLIGSASIVRFAQVEIG